MRNISRRTVALAMLPFVGATVTGCAVDYRPPHAKRMRLADPEAKVADARFRVIVHDVRQQEEKITRQTDVGLFLGDTAFEESVPEFVGLELARAMAAHEYAERVAEGLAQKVLELAAFEVVLGTRISQPLKRQWNTFPGAPALQLLDNHFLDSRAVAWEVVKVRVALKLPNRTLQGFDTHRYYAQEQPSPIVQPARAAIRILVNEFAIYGS